MLLDIIAAFGAALLTGLGIGSGGLLVIYLTLVRDVEQLTSQGLNLLFFLFSSGAAMLYHFPHRKIYIPVVALMSVLGCVGALVGTFLAGYIGGETAKKLFGAMLVISGVIYLKKHR